MKKIMLVSLCCHCVLLIMAQGSLLPGIPSTKQKMIVKDSSGKIYSENELIKLTMRYEYKFVQLDSSSEKIDYLLTKMSEKERKEIMDKIEPVATPYFKTGEMIKSFVAKDMEGNKYKLKEMTEKIVVVYFWYSRSPATSYEVEELNHLVEKYQDNKDVVFLAVTFEDDERIQKFLEKTPFKFHIISSGQYIMDKYDVGIWPTHLVLDKKGIVRLHTLNYAPVLSSFWIDRKIEEIQKEKN